MQEKEGTAPKRKSSMKHACRITPWCRKIKTALHNAVMKYKEDFRCRKRSDEIQGRFSVTFAAQPEVYLLR